MPKRPDYGDATPEDLALALVRFQRPPLKKEKAPEPAEDQRDDAEDEEAPSER